MKIAAKVFRVAEGSKNTEGSKVTEFLLYSQPSMSPREPLVNPSAVGL